MLSEISQSQKDKYCMIPLIRGSYSSQNHKARKYNGGCQGLGKRRMGSHYLIGIEFQIYWRLGIDGGDGCINVNVNT